MQTGRGRGHPASLILEVRAGRAFAALTGDADLLVPGDLTLRTTPVNPMAGEHPSSLCPWRTCVGRLPCGGPKGMVDLGVLTLCPHRQLCQRCGLTGGIPPPHPLPA